MLSKIRGVLTNSPLRVADMERSAEGRVPLPVVIWEETMNGLIYLIGLIVVILFILSFLGLR
jgi:hypothetical protein